ncbi:aldehyde dehydrogenase family protein [Jatrophihabitans fulvus]
MTTSAPRVSHSRESIPDTVARLRTTFRSGRTKPVEWRLDQLAALQRMLVEREAEFVEALRMDLGRPAPEAWLADLAPVSAEIRHASKHLRTWMRPTRVPVPLAVQPGRAWYQYEPLGVVLVIAPWNYPLQLGLGPIVAALAAGNCVVLKPSEVASACASVLARVLPKYLDPEAVAVVEGAVDETHELLDQGFDHCLFTGSPEVGKIVMAAAAKHLTPVTLELGGKSPAIVAADANVKVAARRVAFGKLLNSGQTCIAPDYVLVDRSVRDTFVRELKTALDTFSPEPSLPVVNERHAGRLEKLLQSAGGETVRGGSVETSTHRAQLTVVVDPDAGSDLMREEIFGPILPVVTVDSLDDAIAHVQQGPKPLAMYLFTESRATEERVLGEISSGGACINHLLYHIMVPELPFGGVGNSGTGAYHGSWGFQTFSHRKAVLRKGTRPDPSFAYPPFTRIKEAILRKVF